jgi:hypothetical protein
MFSRERKRVQRHCPKCGAEVNISQSDALRYIFLYRLFRCRSCDSHFDFGRYGKPVLLTMALMVVALALNIQTLIVMSETHPGIKHYLQGGVLLVTVIFAFGLSRERHFTVRESFGGLPVILHYATLIALPGSLLFFWYMAKDQGT